MEGLLAGSETIWNQEGKSTGFSLNGDHHPPEYWEGLQTTSSGLSASSCWSPYQLLVCLRGSWDVAVSVSQF